MEIQHLNLKLFIEDPESVELEAFGGVFNRWIQERAVEELLVDVADYRHVYAGPGVILIGHEANYSLDQTDNRLGLLYNRKAHVPGSLHDKLAQAARALLTAALKLNREEGLRFSTRELQITVNDRLLAPNTPETFSALKDDLRAFARTLFESDDLTLTHHADPRSRFSVSLHTGGAPELAALLRNITAAEGARG